MSGGGGGTLAHESEFVGSPLLLSFQLSQACQRPERRDRSERWQDGQNGGRERAEPSVPSSLERDFE